MWTVPKKTDSKGNKCWRMIIDYRTLNNKTIGTCTLCRGDRPRIAIDHVAIDHVAIDHVAIDHIKIKFYVF